MTEQPGQDVGASDIAVVDTQIVSAILFGQRRPNQIELLRRYSPHIRGKSFVLSFATVCELRYGSLKGAWPDARRQQMEEWFSDVATVAMPDNDLVNICATLRESCRRAGHGLHEKIHDSDRWIASTALRYGIPLISDDGIFKDVPGLALLQERASA